MRGLVDCRGLFETLTCPAVGSLLDQGMIIYLMATREAFADGPLSQIGWIPTFSCLVDAQTKPMEDVLRRHFYLTGTWVPTEVMLCRREGDGSRKFTNYWAVSTFSPHLHCEEEDNLDSLAHDGDEVCMDCRRSCRVMLMWAGHDLF